VPRLRVLPDGEVPIPARKIIESWNLNLHRVLAHSPEMLADWLPWAERVLRNNSLSERDREIVILRVAVKWRSDYEWGLHALVARRIGMTEADLKAVAAGPADPHWAAWEAALLEATDQVLDRKPIDDELWTILARACTSQATGRPDDDHRRVLAGGDDAHHIPRSVGGPAQSSAVGRLSAAARFDGLDGQRNQQFRNSPKRLIRSDQQQRTTVGGRRE
jgi:alkylhydroperoxidase family enzyme